jgi:hypothetical protein
VKSVRGHLPSAAASAVLLAALVILLYFSLINTDGHFVYALDDPYIHMAMAKNFSQHGIWGVTKHEFASASSSVGWTLLLSLLYTVTGVHDVTPFVTNAAIALTFLIVISFLLKRHRLSNPIVFILLILIIVFTPLPVLIFNGMEHLLHAFLTVLFLIFAARAFSSHDSGWFHGPNLALLLLSPFIILTRFEGAFAIIAVGIFLLARKRIGFAIFVGILSILPVVLYQAVAASKGWFWLPNPIVIRAGMSDVASVANNATSSSLLIRFFDVIMQFPIAAASNIKDAPHLGALLVTTGAISVFLWVRRVAESSESRTLLLLFVVTCFFHLLFGKVGHFYRYEAYLVTVGLTAIGSTLSGKLLDGVVTAWKSWTSLWRIVLVAVLVGIFYFPTVRAVEALVLLPKASKNIYEQQYQVAMFVKRYYEGGSVAVNDIGAVNYYADINCLDLVGLASIEVLNKKLTGSYTTEEIRNLALTRGMRIAIAYEHWFGRARTGALPSDWERVAKWTIKGNVVAGGDAVTFYSIDPAEESNLNRNLQEFSQMLPHDVIQSGPYTLSPR